MTLEKKTVFTKPKILVSSVIVLVSVILISFLFPKNGTYAYKFKTGQVWDEENVYAPQDIFIWKKESQIQSEREKALADFRPVFTRIVTKPEYYNLWDEFLIKNDTLLNPTELTRLQNYLNSVQNKEVLRSQDLIYRGTSYGNIHIRSGNNLIEISRSGYITNDEVKKKFAPLLVVVPERDILDRITIQLDTSLSNGAYEEILSSVLTFKRKINNGDLIVAKGSIISQETSEALTALKNETTKSTLENTIVFFGFLLLTCLIIGVFIFYILFHFPQLFYSTRKLGFLMIIIVFMSFLVYSIEESEVLSSYLIPFCIVPIVVKSFFSDRLALFIHIVIVLIASFLSSLGYEFTFLQILAGIVAVLVIEDTRSWNQFFISILSIVAAYFIGYLGLSLIEFHDLSSINWIVYRWLTISGVLTLLAYPFIPLLAKIFGFVSSITLSELSDLNRPVLKELSLHAAGTLHHSLQVANLSEAAAEAIGANSLLLKVGSLYHDIGKLYNPSFFIENQRGINPHDHMTNFESAKAIVDHVPIGVKMAKKNSLPDDLIRMIQTHHGTTKVEYFYRQQVIQFPDKEFDDTLFDYPGPKPKTKEESILMMADSLEAASKSLQNPTGKDIDELVDKIIDYKIKSEQFTESDLTYEEMNKCISVFKSVLRNINHVRVEYPEIIEDQKSEEQASKAL